METPKIIFKTNIDKYQNKFSLNYFVIPRIGEMVKVDAPYNKLPFDELQVINVTYTKEYIVVELDLSELQKRQTKDYNLNVFN